MTEEPKRRQSSTLLIILVFIVGVALGLGIGRWENRVRQNAAGLLGEARFGEVMSEDWDQINKCWDSKPEAARALLERQLRAHERLLQSLKSSSAYDGLFTKDYIDKSMAFIHVKLAILCQRLNDPGCVTEHVAKATELMNMSSSQVYAAMAKLDPTNRVSRQNSK
jgi:hypothetical protein